MAYKYEKAFKHLFPEAEWEPSGGSNFLTNCPFHEHHSSKTLAIDFETGKWHCFNPECDEKGRSIQDLKQKLFKTIQQDNFLQDLQAGQQKIWKDDEALSFLKNKRGLTEETIRQAGIAVKEEVKKHPLTGKESLKKYLLIPVYQNDFILSGRKYLLPAYREEKEPKIKFAWSGSLVSFYPDLPNQKTVYLVEGEWDALLLRQYGFPAVTTTGGQGGASFLKFIEDILQYKKIFICFDCDKAGRKAAHQLSQRLVQEGKEVFVMDLKLGEGEDVTDFFVNYQKTAYDFQRLAENAVQIQRETPQPLAMKEIGAKNLNKKYLVEGRIIGDAGVNKFLYPTYTVMQCDGKDLDICQDCPLYQSTKEVYIPPDDPKVAEFLEQPLSVQQKLLAEIAGIPFITARRRCQFWKQTEDSRVEIGVPVFIESLEAQTPDAKKEMEGYVTTEKAATALKSGRASRFWLKPVQDTRNNGKFIFLADEVEALKDDLDTFKVTSDLHEKLQVFQGDPNTKIPEISRALNRSVFRFQGREELLTTYDLAYHSVLQFKNPNAPNRLVKGWVELLVIGDPGEGKSQLAIEMTEYYGLGSYQDAAKVTPGGLTVSTVQMAGKWVFRDGLLPLNDQRLVFLDEFNKMNGEDLQKLNTARSSGKISASSSAGTYEKSARTRMVWITNPKNGKRINLDRNASEFPVKLITELFNDQGAQDRLDLAVLVLRDDPKPPFPEEEKQQDEHDVYTKDLCRQLLLWAWTRKPHQIYFDDEAVREIRIVSEKLRRQYWHKDSDVELINAGERTTERIMRLSAATAARVYSTADGENLFVTKEHVQFVYQFLVQQYEKMEYGAYIQSLHFRQKVQQERLEEEQKEAGQMNQNPKEQMKQQVSIQEILNRLTHDKWLFDSLDAGHYDLIVEKDSEVVAMIKYLYARGYVRSENSRHFKFTKAFHDELEPKMVYQQVEF